MAIAGQENSILDISVLNEAHTLFEVLETNEREMILKCDFVYDLDLTLVSKFNSRIQLERRGILQVY